MKRWALAMAILVGLAGASAAVILASTEDDPPEMSGRPTPEATAQESPSEDAAACSAAGLPSEVTGQPALPEPVAQTRFEIVATALGCNYQGLEDLALAGDARFGFTYSYGDARDPAGYWEQLENEPKTRFHEPVMSHLVAILNMSYCTQTFERGGNRGELVQYQWPGLSCDVPTDEQWDEVGGLYTEKQIRQMKRFGSGYIGWRAGITEEGDWVFFVAGD